ncbi:MAG: hypothetical protein IJJ85_10545, partial [Clostridia bacterium]|nr:hypothetical protein [Oscillospiraceae bacterium]MBR0510545.1 hypothetical protein [Clostridia bacterium]
IQVYNLLGHSLFAPFECLCRNFILPEFANYVYFYPFLNLRNLLYLIFENDKAKPRSKNRAGLESKHRQYKMAGKCPAIDS